ncbi:MAG: nuclear transport factor 2 family protein [Thermosynechococcaceae cyanobacterium]
MQTPPDSPTPAETPTSPTALDLVHQVYGCFTKGDLSGFLDLCADSIEWVVNGPAALEKCRAFSGKHGVEEFLTILNRDWQFQSFTPRQFITSGSTVVVLGEEAGIDRSTGQPFASRWVHVFDIEEQQVIRFREFLCHWTGDQLQPVMSW